MAAHPNKMATDTLCPKRVSEECEVLIGELGRELAIIKKQLAKLTDSLEEEVVIRPHPPPLRLPPTPRSSVAVLPIKVSPPSPDIPRWSEPVVRVALPPSPPPPPPAPKSQTTSKHKQKSRKVTSPAIDVAPSPEQTQHLLRVVDQRDEIRARARDRYLSLMRDHIQRQLELYAEKEKLLKSKRERREKKERGAKLRLKPVRHRSTGVEDKKYLENLYQSYLYKIIEVEHTFRRCGKLRTLVELKEFWDQMLSPMQATPTPQPQPRGSALSYVEETELRQLEEEGYTNSWAITADSKVDGGRHTVNSVAQSTVPSSLKFTPCQLPDLIPIKEILDKNSEESVNKLRSSVCKSDSLGAKQRVRVQQVYQRAKANEMAMRTLLPHQSSIECPCFVLSDQSLVCPPTPPPARRSEARPHPSVSLPPLVQPDGHIPALTERKTPSLRHTEDLTLSSEKSSSLAEELSRDLSHSLSHSVGASEESVLSSRRTSKPLLVPLTMSALLQSSPIKESNGKRRSSMWSNYEIAGK